jgi:hypothetical protein
MRRQSLNLLQDNSALSDEDIENVMRIIEVADKYNPDEVYLTGSSVDNKEYADVDLALDFSSEMYDESIVDTYLELLDSSRRIGTDPQSREKQRVIVRGELSDTDYDVFIMEENSLSSEKKLDLHPS